MSHRQAHPRLAEATWRPELPAHAAAGGAVVRQTKILPLGTGHSGIKLTRFKILWLSNRAGDCG